MKIFCAFFFGTLMILLGILGIKLGYKNKKDDSDYANAVAPGFFFIGAMLIIGAVTWILMVLFPE